MASLSSISLDLKTLILELIDIPSSTFIPQPNADIISLSRVDKTFRALALPYLFRNIYLLNDKYCGASALSSSDSLYAPFVKELHYIGIENMQDDSTKILPTPIVQVLSNVSRLPNLEKLVMDFRAGETEEEDRENFEESFYDFEHLDEGEDTVELEGVDTFRSMMNQSFTTLTRNLPSVIKHLEIRNTVPKPCSVWRSTEFLALLRSLSSFTFSFRKGDNGAESGWNALEGYVSFVKALDTYFFSHLENAYNISFATSEDGAPGLSGICHIPLPLNVGDMPNLQNLELKHVFIGAYLSDFLVAHGGSVTTVKLNHCYSGLGCDSATNSISWAEFFCHLTSNDMQALRSFVVVSDAEMLCADSFDEAVYQPEDAARAEELREHSPGKRMFQYAQLDMKYGWFMHNMEQTFSRFEQGNDQTAWEGLLKAISKQ